MNNNIEIKTYISFLLSSNMYAIKAGEKLIIIVPFESDDLLDYIESNLLIIDYIILTHEHYDHISGVNWLKDKYKTKIIRSNECSKAIRDPVLNFSKYFDISLELMPSGSNVYIPKNIASYSCSADIIFMGKETIEWMGNKIELTSTPGHSKGSICILINKKNLFSSDSLVRDYPTVTRLKGGIAKEYNALTIKCFNSLNPHTEVFPGHYGGFTLYNKHKYQKFST